MNVTKMLLISFALALPLACGDDDSGTPDGTAEDGGVDVAADADADVTPEADGETMEEADGETMEEADGTECPPDDPDHIYIDVMGQVNPLGTADVGGMYLAAVVPLSALTGTPNKLGETTTDADGTFAFRCVDVKNSALGLIVLADDNPEDGAAGDFFPTFTGVAGWTTDVEKVDLPNAMVFGLPNTLTAGLAALTGVDAAGDGLVMGNVLDGTTYARLAGATVDSVPAGSVTVAYPNADFTGLETSGMTSANGMWLLTEPLTGLTNITATLTGYTFDTHPAATPAGYCFFLPFLSND